MDFTVSLQSDVEHFARADGEDFPWIWYSCEMLRMPRYVAFLMISPSSPSTTFAFGPSRLRLLHCHYPQETQRLRCHDPPKPALRDRYYPHETASWCDATPVAPGRDVTGSRFVFVTFWWGRRRPHDRQSGKSFPSPSSTFFDRLLVSPCCRQHAAFISLGISSLRLPLTAKRVPLTEKRARPSSRRRRCDDAA